MSMNVYFQRAKYSECHLLRHLGTGYSSDKWTMLVLCSMLVMLLLVCRHGPGCSSDSSHI